MEPSGVHLLGERFTGLSDRFRSLWTFYQFLGGVFKHRGGEPIPFSYDFQALHRRIQDLVPRMGVEGSRVSQLGFDQVERELARIHTELAAIESAFPPSLFRRFFDHLKRQDEKILYALTKFYLMLDELQQDTLDKLDILLTRLSEAPIDGDRAVPRDPAEIRATFQRLAAFARISPLPPSEAGPLVEAVREFRTELRSIEDFQGLIDSGVYDRFRRLKQRLGRAFLHPPVLTEIVVTNIEAKNQFDRLYRQEEVKILEETNRMFEIERFLERNPEATHDALRSQIEQWQRSRLRFEAGRRDDNLKRDDVLALRRAMDEVIAAYQRVRGTPGAGAAGTASTVDQDATLRLGPPAAAREVDPFPQVGPDPSPGFADEAESASLTDLLPPDPLLSEPLHKIMFAIEMVAWDRSPDRVVHAPELHNLHLEPWEVAAYRHIVQRTVQEGTTRWELLVFFLRSAALRVKMEEEREEIARLGTADSDERAFELLERSAQSLERAREMDRRFQWFIDDTLYSGDTDQLEQLYRSRFRFLNAYSSLWLEHQAHGGLTPL